MLLMLWLVRSSTRSKSRRVVSRLVLTVGPQAYQGAVVEPTHPTFGVVGAYQVLFQQGMDIHETYFACPGGGRRTVFTLV
jgi:hypothetical protein